MSLYAPEGPGVWAMVRGCSRATVGDVVLTITAYAIVAVFVRDWSWLLRLTPGLVVAFLAIGLSLGATLEAMGFAPLLQWVVVPLIVLVGAARVVRQ